MIVTAAVSGPRIQSSALTGGNSDCSVGPGVGWGLTTVQAAAAAGPRVAAVSETLVRRVAVGAGKTSVGKSPAVGSGALWVAPWQAVRRKARTKSSDGILMSFKSFFSRSYANYPQLYQRMGQLHYQDP
jgi:hypothetical protein